MQPDNERIIELVAQTESQVRLSLIEIIQSGATALTIMAIAQGLDLISRSYFPADNYGMPIGGVIAAAPMRPELNEESIKAIVLEELKSAFEEYKNKHVSQDGH